MNKNTYLVIGLLAMVIVGWFLTRKKKSPESSFRRRLTGSGGTGSRTIYKCSRTVSNCDWGCAGNSITCPPGCMTTSTQTFENYGPCPLGTNNLGIVRWG